MEHKKVKKNKKETVEIKTIIYAVIVIILLYLTIIGIAIYGFGIYNNLIRKTASIIPYPAAFLESDWISLDSLNNRTKSVKKFYESQDFSSLGMRVDFSTEDGKKRLKIKEKMVLNKMIEDKIIENEANKKGIILTKEIISQEVDRKMKEYGSENYLKENLMRLYGWSIEDFEEYIVKPDIYREKLFENIQKNDPSSKKSEEKIYAAKKDLENKSDFGEIVKKYSEGESAKNNGSLGWFNTNQMLPEIATAIFSLEKGKTSNIIRSTIGYHIVKIDDKKNENGEDMFKISQIFVRTTTITEWLINQEKNVRISIPLKEYYWDKKSLSVEFKNEEMKKFEENIIQNSSDDVSMAF